MTPEKQLAAAVKNIPAAKVKYAKRWDDIKIRGRLLSGRFEPRYVMVHHTAGTNSLNWLALGKGHEPVPGAHFLIAKDGTVHVLTKFQCYHAGIGSGWGVPVNLMNPFAWGIEVESLGAKKDFTDAQKESLGALISGLLDGMGKSTKAIINHRDWSPNKVDSRYPTGEIAGWVGDYRAKVGKVIALGGGYSKDPGFKRASVSASGTKGAALIKGKEEIPTGRWVTVAEINIPKVSEYRYLLTFQIAMPKALEGGEFRLARAGWGAQADEQGGFDWTGHNPIPPRSLVQRWRTLKHEISGGGPVQFQVYLMGKDGVDSVTTSFVAKATRFRVR